MGATCGSIEALLDFLGLGGVLVVRLQLTVCKLRHTVRGL